MTERTRMSREDLLNCIRQDLDRAYRNAEHRLDEASYDIGDGLWTYVEVKARRKDGGRVGKFYRVGEAVNLREWSDE
jgi:AAA+ ATPase superfamily predicted ATPase